MNQILQKQQREQDELEAKHDFWSTSGRFIFRHHVEDRQKLYVPQDSSFLIPLKYVDVVRRTHNTLDVLIIIGTLKVIDRTMSRQWTSFHPVHSIEYYSASRIHVVRGRATKMQATSRPENP